MLKKRYLTPFVVEDLKDKMVFVSGARQVGKTTLSTELVTRYYPRFAYFNWDFQADRKKNNGRRMAGGYGSNYS